MKKETEGISQAYKKIVQPWTKAELNPPELLVIELARRTGLPPIRLINILLNKKVVVQTENDIYRLRLEGPSKERVTRKNLKDVAQKAGKGKYKRAAKDADYRSREPGGGPVVKRKIKKDSLERQILIKGYERLKIVAEKSNPDGERRERREGIKAKLALRWQGRSVRWQGRSERRNTDQQYEKEDVGITVFNLIKKISDEISNPKELLNRLRDNAKLGKPQFIIVVWGPPYVGQAQSKIFEKTTPEKQTAKAIGQVMEQLTQYTEMEMQLLVIYADYYGTEINKLPTDEVTAYGKQLKEYFESLGGIFTTWSEIKRKNDISDTPPTTDPSGQAVRNAFIIQKKLGRYPSQRQAQKLATAYEAERQKEGKVLAGSFLVEGRLVTNVIKLSIAPGSANDDPYEKELPRFYVKGMLRAPWNKEREL